MVELWDVYDKDRKPVGRLHRRGVRLKPGEYHIICEAWIVSHGKLLVTQRHPDKNFGCLWECTGGAAKAGETSVEAILREIKEEIGVEATEDQLTFMGCATGNTFFIDCYALEIDAELSDLKLQREEVINAKFVTLPEFQKMQGQKKIIPRLYDYMRQFNFGFVNG